MALIMLKMFPRISSFLRVFVFNSMAVDFCQMLLASIDTVMWFYFLEY